MYVLAMPGQDALKHGGYERFSISDGLRTRHGRIELAGEVRDAEPTMLRRFRVLAGYAVSVVHRGSGRYLTGTRASLPITSPAITVVAPGEEHWYGTEPGHRWSEWFAVVDGPIFSMVLSSGAGSFRSGPRPLPPGAAVADLAEILGAPAPRAVAEDQVWALAHWLDRAVREPSDPESELWNRAAALLTDDLSSRPSLVGLAAELGLSYSTFRRHFHERFGQAPLAYRNERRLQSAASLLRLTALSCREIAEQLGYVDEFHLSRRFKERFGVAPTHYR